MALRIPYESHGFPTIYCVGSGVLTTSWDELLWAAITIGRPNIAHVFQHGEASFHEALFRLSLIQMAIEQDFFGELNRTEAFAALDPTEKGAVSYFLGLTLCKLFASRFLAAPWLLHLDVFRASLNPALLGRSRPDLVGLDTAGRWHVFECKGRSDAPSFNDIRKAKTQAQRLSTVDGTPCSLRIGTFAYFRSNVLHFYWRDPSPGDSEFTNLLLPDQGWRYYYEPALALVSDSETSMRRDARNPAQVFVDIHSEIHEQLSKGRWTEAHETARQNRKRFEEEGFQPDGLRVKAGDSWQQPLKSTPEG